MTDQADRLKRARIDAGYETAVDAARRFGWRESTYLGHENGSRNYKAATAKRYAVAFRTAPALLLYGEASPLMTQPSIASKQGDTADTEYLSEFFRQFGIQALRCPEDEATLFAQAALSIFRRRRSLREGRLDKDLMQKEVASLVNLYAN